MFSVLESLYYITVCIFTQTCQCNFNLIWFSSLTLLAKTEAFTTTETWFLYHASQLSLLASFLQICMCFGF